MSTIPRSNPTGYAEPPAEPREAALDAVDAPQASLLDETKNQIRELVHEIAQLVQAEIPAAEFHAGFLSRVMQALAAAGGGIWLLDGQRRLQLAYQVSLDRVGLPTEKAERAQHEALLGRVLETGKPILVPPHARGAEESAPGNPTQFLLLAVPLRIDQEVIGLLEVFQPARGGPTTQRGFLRFAAQMCDLAGEYYKSRQLREYGRRAEQWEGLEKFLQQLYRRLSVADAAFTLANDGRRLIECDRLTVAVPRRGGYEVECVSGLDSLDRRAAQVKLLGELASAVARTGEPLWFGENAAELPPQLETLVQQSVDASHARRMVIVPLTARTEDSEETAAARKPKERPSGVLIVEMFREGAWSEDFPKRLETVAAHGGMALANAAVHEQIFLLPLWQALGSLRNRVAARSATRLAAMIGVPLVALVLLGLMPADFDLAATGKLRPEVTRDVFATADGIISEVPVDHRSPVRAGQLIARLDDPNLESEITGVLGRLAAASEQVDAAQRSLLDPQLSIDEQNRITGRLLELQETAGGLRQQLKLLTLQQEQLEITSPIAGEVVTWRVQDQLVRRPVKKGQVLLTVIQPEGPWELELHLPDRRVGHVLAAREESQEPLTVWFRLASHPGKSFSGKVVDIQRSAEVQEGGGTGVMLRVAIDNYEELPDRRFGTAVTARIHCGRSPLAYVWLHEVIEVVQSRVLFWL